MSDGEQHKQLAGALGRVPSGLFVLTARRGDAETGMLASWVQQCAFEPPLVSVALRRDRSMISWLTDGSLFSLNILEAGQTDMIAHFGRGFAAGEPAFTELEIDRSAEGGPVLTEALAHLVCRVTAHFSAGDHELLLAEVTAGRVLNEGQPMVHVRKSGFHY
jgi:flavin reductase (DIM6/NTAB) family NADH-FMN oxidoreductase RutF